MRNCRIHEHSKDGVTLHSIHTSEEKQVQGGTVWRAVMGKEVNLEWFDD
jgi:hypothetical protein